MKETFLTALTLACAEFAFGEEKRFAFGEGLHRISRREIRRAPCVSLAFGEEKEKRSAERLGARELISSPKARDSVTREIRCTSLGASLLFRRRRTLSPKAFSRASPKAKRLSRTGDEPRLSRENACASLVVRRETRRERTHLFAEGERYSVTREIRCKAKEKRSAERLGARDRLRRRRSLARDSVHAITSFFS